MTQSQGLGPEQPARAIKSVEIQRYSPVNFVVTNKKAKHNLGLAIPIQVVDVGVKDKDNLIDTKQLLIHDDHILRNQSLYQGKLEVAAALHKGIEHAKDENGDSYRFKRLSENRTIFILADAKGDTEKAVEASKMATGLPIASRSDNSSGVIEAYEKRQAVIPLGDDIGQQNGLIAALETADRDIRNRNNQDRLTKDNRLITTCIAVVIDRVPDGNGGFMYKYYAANAGDSRVEQKSGVEQTLKPITIDNNGATSLALLGNIHYDDINSSPFRGTIYEYLGNEKPVTVSVNSGSLHPGDTLLLTSDGITGVVYDQAVNNVLTKEASAERIIEDLMGAALEAGGPDNIAAVVIKFPENPNDVRLSLRNEWHKPRTKLERGDQVSIREEIRTTADKPEEVRVYWKVTGGWKYVGDTPTGEAIITRIQREHMRSDELFDLNDKWGRLTPEGEIEPDKDLMVRRRNDRGEMYHDDLWRIQEYDEITDTFHLAKGGKLIVKKDMLDKTNTFSPRDGIAEAETYDKVVQIIQDMGLCYIQGNEVQTAYLIDAITQYFDQGDENVLSTLPSEWISRMKLMKNNGITIQKQDSLPVLLQQIKAAPAVVPQKVSALPDPREGTRIFTIGEAVPVFAQAPLRGPESATEYIERPEARELRLFILNGIFRVKEAMENKDLDALKIAMRYFKDNEAENMARKCGFLLDTSPRGAQAQLGDTVRVDFLTTFAAMNSWFKHGITPSIIISEIWESSQRDRPMPFGMYHDLALLHLEEWTHALQYLREGHTIAGFQDPELDAAAWFSSLGLELTQQFLYRYDRESFVRQFPQQIYDALNDRDMSNGEFLTDDGKFLGYESKRGLFDINKIFSSNKYMPGTHELYGIVFSTNSGSIYHVDENGILSVRKADHTRETLGKLDVPNPFQSLEIGKNAFLAFTDSTEKSINVIATSSVQEAFMYNVAPQDTKSGKLLNRILTSAIPSFASNTSKKGSKLLNSYLSQPGQNEFYKTIDTPAKTLEGLIEFANHTTLEKASTYRNALDWVHEKLRNTEGIISIPDKPTIIIPDIHARKGMIIDILKHEITIESGALTGKRMTIFEALKNQAVNIVCVGDIVHSENRNMWVKNNSGESDPALLNQEMVNSLGAATMIMYLIKQYPQNFFSLRGNHDDMGLQLSSYRKYVGVEIGENGKSTGNVNWSVPGDAELVKQWILQNKEQGYGASFLSAWSNFENLLPLIAVAQNEEYKFIVSHTIPDEELAVADIRNRMLFAKQKLTNSRELVTDAINKTLQNLFGSNRNKIQRWFHGHTPVKKNEGKYEEYGYGVQMGGYVESPNGRLVRLNNQKNYVFAYVSNIRAFNASTDVYIKRPHEPRFGTNLSQ